MNDSSHKLAVVGAAPGSASFGMAASLAALYGLLAHRRTLWADLSLESDAANQHLGLADPRSIEPLVRHFLRAGTLDHRIIEQQIAGYEPPIWLGPVSGAFDVLAGPSTVTAYYRDSLAAQRGEAFARQLHDQIAGLGYDVVIVDFGQSLDTLRGTAIADRADLVAVVCRRQDEASRTYLPQRLQGQPFAGILGRLVLVEAGTAPFPHPSFVESLTSRAQSFQDATSRTALALAERLHPAIQSELKDSDGHPIRPAREGLLSRLFG
jgi:hypothetical protein